MPKKKHEEPVQPKKADRRRMRRWFIGVSSFVLIVLAAFAVYAFAYQSRIVPRTTVGGVAVGGLTRQQAGQALAAREQAFSHSQVTLTYEGKDWRLTPSDLGLSFADADALDAAYSYGRGGSFMHRLAALLAAPFSSRSLGLSAASLTADGAAYLQANVQQDIEQPFSETSLSLTPGHVTVQDGVVGQKLDGSKLLSDLAAAFATGTRSVSLSMNATTPEITPAQAEAARTEADAMLVSPWTIQAGNQSVTLKPADIVPWLSTSIQRDASGIATSLVLNLDDAKLKAYASGLTGKIQQLPTNAVLGVVDGSVTVVREGKDGVTLDLDQTAVTLRAALTNPSPTTRTVAASAKVVHPDISSSTLAALGLTQLIGTGTTDFSGSPSNRVANITKGEQMVSGQVVQDGAEFSTITSLGPIDQAHGYVQGLVIVNNKTLPADGGGLCQVSTTLFRSVLNAGLPVTARTNHSYEVSYYQRGIGPGLDATIYDPQPDFKWRNDTGHAIYIQGTIKGTTLTFDLYGTSDGRTAVVDGPHTLQSFDPSGDPIKVETDTLPKGTEQMIDPPVPGARTTATYTVTRGGEVINTQTFNSFYQAMPAQYLVGTR